MEGASGGKARIVFTGAADSPIGLGNRVGEFHHHAVETALPIRIANARIGMGFIISGE
jgi:hypothetical protein